jgi:hypothetical protein
MSVKPLAAAWAWTLLCFVHDRIWGLLCIVGIDAAAWDPAVPGQVSDLVPEAQYLPTSSPVPQSASPSPSQTGTQSRHPYQRETVWALRQELILLRHTITIPQLYLDRALGAEASDLRRSRPPRTEQALKIHRRSLKKSLVCAEAQIQMGF